MSEYALPLDARVGRIVLSDGGELAYEERGAGPAIVFLHSSIADRSMWRPVARLADRYRCVALDTASVAPSLPSGVVAIAAGAGGWTYRAEVQAFYAELTEIAAEEGPEAAVDAEIDFWVLRGRPRASLGADALACLRAAVGGARALSWDRSLC